MNALKVSLAALAVVLGAARAQAQSCTNDVDCDCGQVCSYIVSGGPSCVSANGGDPGWCTPNSPGIVNGGCIYACQSCVSAYCEPAWSATSVCVKGTTGGSSGGVSCPSSTTGGGASSGGTSSSGGVASSSSGGGSSSGGAKGTSSGGVDGTNSSGGAGGTTGGSSTSGGGGGCSQAPGDFCWMAAALAIGLAMRSRRRRVHCSPV